MKYTGEHLKEISFPLGGIGTGSIGLAGNGRLLDFEIFNRPNKGSINGYTHFAIRTIAKDGSVNARVLNGDICKDLQGHYKKSRFTGYGFGPDAKTMCGFRHFRECEFEGEFPIANLYLADTDFPGKIRMTGFNPFIPLNSEDSSIPAAFFEIEVENTLQEELVFDCAFSVGNPFAESCNLAGERDGLKYIQLLNAGKKEDEKDYGDLTVCCADQEAVLQRYWYRGGWQDAIVMFWNEFSAGKQLTDRTYDTNGSYDMCSMMSRRTVPAGEKARFQFVLSWNVPLNYAYWKDNEEKDVTWKNFYATVFEDSVASAVYSMKNFKRLYEETQQFKEELFASTLDPAVIDAAASTLSVLKSPTVYRLENGEFYGFEGVHEQAGSCEGTCQHVWNYAYALCFLFPDLARSIHELEFQYSMAESGKMRFRLHLPLDKEFKNRKVPYTACVDGQMGTIIKLYRDWKISGNDEWLEGHYEDMVRILEYAWSEENDHEWDCNKDGVMEGRQHHTLDMELFGPSSWLQGFYLGALKAAAEIAAYLGHEDKASGYLKIYENGRAWTNEKLFNGEYFVQQVDLQDRGIAEHFGVGDRYWNEETGELKYQLAEGCEIDQLCGQWHANICNLGRIFDKEKTQIALQNLYKNNFKCSMRDFDNPWRVFALNDEPGAVICTYPEGSKKPSIPLPYCEESMNGFEYQMAGLLISEGFVEEGLEVVRGVRSKYNGANRNPYNEMECGSNYARSMASYALIPIFSGFVFDLPHHRLGFNPIRKGDYFRSIWSLDGAWGNVVIDKERFECNIIDGSLKLRCMDLKFIRRIKEVMIDGEKVAYTFENGDLCFDNCIVKKGVKVCFEK